MTDKNILFRKILLLSGGLAVAGLVVYGRPHLSFAAKAKDKIVGLAQKTIPKKDEVVFSINPEVRHPISQFIYGTNAKTASAGQRYTLARFGGNRLSAYNWENNASNAGSDWQHQNDDILGGGTETGGAVKQYFSYHNPRVSHIMTIPMIGYVAADTRGGGDVQQTSNYLATRFKQSKARKGKPFTLKPDGNDAYVYQDEYVYWLKAHYPEFWAGSGRLLFYALDNEPDLWSHTHARIHPDPVTYAELLGKTIEYAAAIKDVDPNATILGPVSYGWNGYVNLQNAPDAKKRDFLEFYLKGLNDAERSHGRRLVDVLDLHFYSEATANNVRVNDSQNTAEVVAARMQAPRSLWDPSYEENSWIAKSFGPVRLIPRLKEKIEKYYPGTKIAFTEYNFGGGDDISGGVAQADTLGIFGREGVYIANLWELNPKSDFIYSAFDMYRAFDSCGRKFGNTSIKAKSSDDEVASVYASIQDDNPSLMTIIAVNKSPKAIRARIAFSGAGRYKSVEVYQLSELYPRPAKIGDVKRVGEKELVYLMPAMSVSTLVLGDATDGYCKDRPPPLQPPPGTIKKAIYNGETAPFKSWSPWDKNGSTLEQSSANPFSQPNHLRATLKVVSWWGAVAYVINNWSSDNWGYRKSLVFQAKADLPVNVDIQLFDANGKASVSKEIALISSYRKFVIPLDELSGVSIDRIQAIVIAARHDGVKTHIVDLDDIGLAD